MPQKKILIVDDNKDLRDSLYETFVANGFSVIRAANGEESLALAFSEKPDLILLDIMMPQMNGYQVLQKLRADPWGKTAEIILLTSLDDMTNIAKAVEYGCNEYIIKSSTSLKAILEKVKKRLRIPLE